ncbi:hypothetical protein DIPPA_15960 [Diplonema papillatum]|nr:hypothetical protein DIPPA_15960 [Diplonema papillatum]
MLLLAVCALVLGPAAAAAAALDFDSSAWRHDAANNVYYRLGVGYCAEPGSSDMETLAVYVPGAYLTPGDARNNSPPAVHATVNPGGTVGNFTARTAPVVFRVVSPDYSASPSPSEYRYEDVRPFVEAGFVLVHPGLRGRAGRGNASSGSGAPWGLVGLKAAVRFFRYNGAALPGDGDAVFAFGSGAGGALSCLAGVSGDSALYGAYLSAMGAAMVHGDGRAVSDSIAGSMCWSPSFASEAMDAAYEWEFGQPQVPGGNTAWLPALSADLASRFARFVDSAEFVVDQGAALTVNTTATLASSSYAAHVLFVVQAALDSFLTGTTFPYEDPSTLVVYDSPRDYVDSLDAGGVRVSYEKDTLAFNFTSLSELSEALRPQRRLVPAYDAVDKSAVMNGVFQDAEGNLRHFDRLLSALMLARRSAYSGYSDWDGAVTGEYAVDLLAVDGLNTPIEQRVQAYDPFFFLLDGPGQQPPPAVAKHFRIRSGVAQSDTPLAIDASVTLALRKRLPPPAVDYEAVWGQGSGAVERAGGDPARNFVEWVTGKVRAGGGEEAGGRSTAQSDLLGMIVTCVILGGVAALALLSVASWKLGFLCRPKRRPSFSEVSARSPLSIAVDDFPIGSSSPTSAPSP